MTDIKAIGAAIKRERKASNLTQSELGEYAGTGLNFISQLERGKETARFDKVLSVLKVLGLTLELKRGKRVLTISPELLHEAE